MSNRFQVRATPMKSIQDAGDGATLLQASLSGLKGSDYRLHIKDGLFPAVAFNQALRELSAERIAPHLIKAVDFEGSLAKDLRKHVKNRAKLLLGKKVKVRENISLRQSERAATDDFGDLKVG